jgi:penicillin-binding protein 1B
MKKKSPTKKKPIKIIAPVTLAIFVFLLAGLYCVNYIYQVNDEIREKFDGKRWSVPAVIYARPLELYPGMQLTPEMFIQELQLAGYRQENPVQSPGGYFRRNSTITLITRDFTFSSGLEQSIPLRITFSANSIARLDNSKTGEEIAFARIDPARIGSFHPLVHEDRLVLKSSEIPDMLRQTLITVEDKNFNTHHGISPTGILRALYANIKAGRTVQGGSTLTQQLVKNFFLNRDRTLLRKIQEAVMAILLDYHYSKDDILTAYLNEVFLGQDGGRAIHGFGLASQFYFRRNINDLSVAQIATLVGMVKGPSYYDPRKHPENCLTRREVILRLMLADNIITNETYTTAQKSQLSDVAPQASGFNRFPAFLDLVRRQLTEQYKEEDLKSNGLKILTTLDPQIQWHTEKQIKASTSALANKTDRKELQGAMIVTGRENGEIQAIVGSVNPLDAGFNRAIDAQRQIGSLVKPAVYLAALARGYTLASPIMDVSLAIDNDGKSWRPENYDKKEHGQVAVYQALAKSYNLATVRLGMDVGLQNVITTVRDLGYPEPLQPYPSLLLGSVTMSPLQVSQIYQTIASGGFYLPLRSIHSVMDSENKVLTRYGLEVEQRFSPELMFVLTHALERVMHEGTGSRLQFSQGRFYAGKTGTSNDLRDSWFAGFSDAHLAVVWLGRDDNKPVSLTGSTGALKVWGKVMEEINSGSFEATEPENIVWQKIDTTTLQPATAINRNSTLLPFVSGTEPVTSSWNTPGIDIQRIEDGAKKFLESLNNLIR